MKHNLAAKIDPHAVELDGTLLRAEDGTFAVATARGEVMARRAVSCLVEPEPDDRVLLCALASGDWFILAVLERRAGAPAQIRHDGDLEVRLDHGRYAVVAQDGVTVTTPRQVGVVAGEVDVRSVQANVAVESLSLLGRLAQADFERLKLFAGSCDSLFERVSQRVKRSYRVVEEIDQLKAHAVDYVAKSILRLHGKNTVITSEELVKVDGRQIHMG